MESPFKEVPTQHGNLLQHIKRIVLSFIANGDCIVLNAVVGCHGPLTVECKSPGKATTIDSCSFKIDGPNQAIPDVPQFRLDFDS